MVSTYQNRHVFDALERIVQSREALSEPAEGPRCTDEVSAVSETAPPVGPLR